MNSSASFYAGFGQVDVTPSQLGVPMNGHGNPRERLSTNHLTSIYAIAVAVSDGEGNTAVMLSLDSCNLPTETCDEMRQWVLETYNIPKENVLLSAIHQHTCPDATAENYHDELMQGLKTAIDTALADRAPAKMYTNKVATHALNFVRHLWANDGTFVTSHSGSAASGLSHYASPVDNEMRLIKFVREGKAPIILVNFQCHPHMGSTGKITDIHSDWPGAMRDEVREKLGAHCIYYSGAGGNVSSASRIEKDNVTVPKNDFIQHGKRAAQYVIGAESSYQEAKTGTIRCKEITNIYKADHSLDHLLEAAKVVVEARKQGVAHAKEVKKQFPELNSIYQAGAVVKKVLRGDTEPCTLSAITFGDVAFTAHPYEMFDTNGVELRSGTVGNENYAAEDQLDNPFPMTFVVSKANGRAGYVPSMFGYIHGGYERDTTPYAAGSGELMVGDYLHILDELHKG